MIVYIILMESTVTAIQMRRKFGSIIDRVLKGEHITVTRGHQALVTLIPAQEHEAQCKATSRVQKLEEALESLEEWRKKNPQRAKKLSQFNSTEFIRKMRDER